MKVIVYAGKESGIEAAVVPGREARMPPIILYAGSPETLLSRVEAAIRVARGEELIPFPIE